VALYVSYSFAKSGERPHPSREGEVLIDMVKPVVKARPMQLMSSPGPRQLKTCVYVESGNTALLPHAAVHRQQRVWATTRHFRYAQWMTGIGATRPMAAVA
jgi:hypothetical protein